MLRLGGPSAQILLDHSVNIIMTTGCHDDCDCRLSILLVKLYSHRDYDYIWSSAMKVASGNSLQIETWRINSAVKITFTSWQHETQHGATSGRICQKWISMGNKTGATKTWQWSSKSAKVWNLFNNREILKVQIRKNCPERLESAASKSMESFPYNRK